ncbi:basic proline-rich protein-like [Alligator mississippiensis]|uniref:Basic proline-rich protein-like n=1 Tax=Alligator mississippiensis TaxID=8496 RepID=A0A151MVL2_ALLMI|nr:basic proline-rich protein-like [Alligator mississippiensis]
MESSGTGPSLPGAQDSQDSNPETAAGLTRPATGAPQDPASPDQHPDRAAPVLPGVQELAGGPLPSDQQSETQECMVDSQPILFSENPFVVANRRGKAAGKACLGGPPLGYGRGGVLKTNLYSKASALQHAV